MSTTTMTTKTKYTKSIFDHAYNIQKCKAKRMNAEIKKICGNKQIENLFFVKWMSIALCVKHKRLAYWLFTKRKKNPIIRREKRQRAKWDEHFFLVAEWKLHFGNIVYLWWRIYVACTATMGQLHFGLCHFARLLQWNEASWLILYVCGYNMWMCTALVAANGVAVWLIL
jgi:hypothetical protein